MGLRDRAADCEPQTHTGDDAFAIATLKLVEQARRITRRQPGTIVVDDYAQEGALRNRGYRRA